MKKSILTAAMAITVLMGWNGASAEMVDIGMGRMEKSEFLALEAMVQGKQASTGTTEATPLKRVERYGPVEMSRADFDALRDRVAGVIHEGEGPSIVTPGIQTVSIGTGRMPLDEFLALKRMVEGPHHGFIFGRMAKAQP